MRVSDSLGTHVWNQPGHKMRELTTPRLRSPQGISPRGSHGDPPGGNLWGGPLGKSSGGSPVGGSSGCKELRCGCCKWVFYLAVLVCLGGSVCAAVWGAVCGRVVAAIMGMIWVDN